MSTLHIGAKKPEYRFLSYSELGSIDSKHGVYYRALVCYLAAFSDVSVFISEGQWLNELSVHRISALETLVLDPIRTVCREYHRHCCVSCSK